MTCVTAKHLVFYCGTFSLINMIQTLWYYFDVNEYSNIPELSDMTLSGRFDHSELIALVSCTFLLKYP